MPKAATHHCPENMTPVSPHLICADAAKAIDFYVRAFGAEEKGRMTGPDGKIVNAMVSLEGCSIMLVDENVEYGMRSPQSLGGSPVSIHVYVADVDALAAQAEAEGARIMTPVSDQFWGSRFCMLTDPFGHIWSFATHKLEMTPDEMDAAAREFFEKQ